MKQAGRWTKMLVREVFSEQGTGIEVYHYFARSIGLVLSIAVSIIMIFSLYYLFQGLYETLVEGPVRFDYAVFQHFFEMVLTALIALEFNHTLTEIVTGRGGLIQVKAVVLIGILVVVRKFILIEIETTAPLFWASHSPSSPWVRSTGWWWTSIGKPLAQAARPNPEDQELP